MLPAYCANCIHYKGLIEDGSIPRDVVQSDDEIHSCEAFPEGIPEDVIAGDADHSQPIEGDHGIRFEALAADGPSPGAH